MTDQPVLLAIYCFETAEVKNGMHDQNKYNKTSWANFARSVVAEHLGPLAPMILDPHYPAACGEIMSPERGEALATKPEWRGNFDLLDEFALRDLKRRGLFEDFYLIAIGGVAAPAITAAHHSIVENSVAGYSGVMQFDLPKGEMVMDILLSVRLPMGPLIAW